MVIPFLDTTLNQNASCRLILSLGSQKKIRGTNHPSDLGYVTFFRVLFKHKFRTCSSSNYCIEGVLSAFKAEVLGQSKVPTLHRRPLNKKAEEGG